MYNDHSMVALGNLVPDDSNDEHSGSTAPSFVCSSAPYPTSSVADDQPSLETRRVEALRYKYAFSDLNPTAQQILSDSRLSNTATNQAYKRGQLLFLEWCTEHTVEPHSFTPPDLVNFLSDMYTTHSFAASTLQLFRAAITHFNIDPIALRNSDLVNDFITTLLNQAPPVRLHRPTISLQPTIQYLRSLNSDTISLAALQKKLVFLLGITCFLRPSDLHRIPFSTVCVSEDNTSLSFEVHSPKEKRNRRHIIKSFTVKAHTDLRMCPVATFRVYASKRPNTCVDSLFLNSIKPNQPLRCGTIRAWASSLLRLSTSEPRVSLRSIGSSLALASGIPKEDIVTMGNWASSTTFETHYRREHLSNFDFTNTLLPHIGESITEDDDEVDIFHDAMDTLE